MEKDKWSGLTKKEKQKMLYSFENPVKEKEITQELRQEGYDNYTTTDDHGMNISGIATDLTPGLRPFLAQARGRN